MLWESWQLYTAQVATQLTALLPASFPMHALRSPLAALAPSEAGQLARHPACYGAGGVHNYTPDAASSRVW